VKHFHDAACADFVRELLSPQERAAMQAHLESGCKKCVAAVELWRTVFHMVNEEKGLGPPDDIVRIAKTQFAALAALGNQRVRLVFDSLLQPSEAAVRGAVSARQFLFETDELYVDLRLDPQAERVSLVGQVMDRSHATEAVQGLPIHLQQGPLQLKATNTNQFGEFQFEFDTGTDFYISIVRNEKPTIVLPLYGTYRH
jgi:hypothetical protein